MPRPEKGPLIGRVVMAGEPGRGVAGARIEVAALTVPTSWPRPVTADDTGRFKIERDLDKSLLFASSPDGSLGAIVSIGAEDPEVVVSMAPTASATGLMLDEKGQPAANAVLDWATRLSWVRTRTFSKRSSPGV